MCYEFFAGASSLGGRSLLLAGRPTPGRVGRKHVHTARKRTGQAGQGLGQLMPPLHNTQVAVRVVGTLEHARALPLILPLIPLKLLLLAQQLLLTEPAIDEVIIRF